MDDEETRIRWLESLEDKSEQRRAKKEHEQEHQ